VQHLHIENGYGDPGISQMAKLELVLRGIKMVQAAKGKGRARQPITLDVLWKLKGVWCDKTPGWDQKMLWAAASICFFGFLRSGEITIPTDSSFDDSRHLTFQDISVDSLDDPSKLRVHIKASKTDPFRRGVDVFVGRSGCTLCPVAAMLDYLVVRGSGAGPFFVFEDRRPLTRARFVERVREAATKAGLDCSPSWV